MRSRSYAVLLDALNRHCGKGQQKVTVEHVHVHSGGQAVVGMVVSRSTYFDGLSITISECPRTDQLRSDLGPAPRARSHRPPVPFSVRSEPSIGKPEGPSRLAGSDLSPPVPRCCGEQPGGDLCPGKSPRPEAQWGDSAMERQYRDRLRSRRLDLQRGLSHD